MEQITIRCFRAVDDRQRCVRFLMEHIRVLDDIGVTSAIKPDITWCTDPRVVVVVAEHAELGMVGGLRLHMAVAGQKLPFTQLVRDLDPTAHEKVVTKYPEGCGEISGLWVARRFNHRGLPVLLTEAGIAVAPQAGLRSLICFAASYSAWYAERAGCTIMPAVGASGWFEFPIAGFRSKVLLAENVISIDLAESGVRTKILSLRIRPDQTRVERPREVDLEVRYALDLSGTPGSLVNTAAWHKRSAA